MWHTVVCGKREQYDRRGGKEDHTRLGMERVIPARHAGFFRVREIKILCFLLRVIVYVCVRGRDSARERVCVFQYTREGA